jgi:D-lactate dehydrogenase
MKVALFSSKAYDKTYFEQHNADFQHEIRHFEMQLNATTAQLLTDETAVCAFVNDDLNAATIEALQQKGVQLIALRCAGFNNVDLNAAKRCGISVVRVPAYSPYAVAEHTVALIQTLNRKTHKAYNFVGRFGRF